MKKSGFLALLFTAALAGSAVYYKYDELSGAKALAAEGHTETIKIAYLPITHALPLFETAALLEEQGVKVELVKYGGWSELMDALNTGRVDGASVLVELAMKAREQGIPLELGILGHRDGNVIITRTELSEAEDLAGGTFAIPNTQSTHNLLLQLLLEENGMSLSDITVVELSPAEMPSALQNGQIDGYCVAEPFGAKAVEAGFGRVFASSKDLWPNSICCGIVFHQEAMEGKQETAALFEKTYQEVGERLTKEEALKIAETYLGQDAETAGLSLQWISFQELSVDRAAYETLTDKIRQFGLSENPPAFEDFVQR